VTQPNKRKICKKIKTKVQNKAYRLKMTLKVNKRFKILKKKKFKKNKIKSNCNKINNLMIH